jgi:hypothetical protein
MNVNFVSGLDYVKQAYSSSDRILLINPPVIETRYQWIRWNQPLDLLKLSSFLQQEFGCEVKLFDFMLPVNGKVTRTANRPDSNIEVGGYSYHLWRYGRGEEDFSRWLDRLILRWRPTEIWVTSLTSYWWRGVARTIARIKNKLPDVQVILYGQYPILEPIHAKNNSFADAIVTEKINLTDYFADFNLYEESKPAFCALDISSSAWPKEVIEKVQSGISDFVFFNDPLVEDSPKDALQQIELLLNQTDNISSKRRLKFHALCGLYPSSFTKDVAKKMQEAGFAQLHFEYEGSGSELNLDAYIRAKESYDQAGYTLDPDQISGFLNIGLPSDDLECIIRHTLNLFEIFGSVILKPYTPTPSSELYQKHRDQLETERIELLSPHFFPFSGINEITPKEYDELYTLAASLNHKVRSKAFNCFPGTLAYEMIKTSLERDVWKLG